MTIAAIGTALAVGGSVLGGIQGYNAGQYRAQVATMNAQIAEQNAERAVQTAQVEQMDQDTLTLAALGELTAAQGASGLSLGSKSLVGARKNVRTLGRLDALRVRQAGDIEAYNYKTDAANFLSEANAARAEGRSALFGGFLNAGSSLIGGAGRVKSPARYGSTTSLTSRLPRPRPRTLAR